MKPEKILTAMNDIDGKIILEAHDALPRSKRPARRRIAVLVAAVVALMAMTVTAFAAEDIAGWFRNYFSNQSETDLTPGQIEFIEENEQVVTEAQEENGWTVELRSAISDGEKAYFIIGITAPEDVSLDEKVVDGSIKGRFTTGNHMYETIIPSVPRSSIDDNYQYVYRVRWEEDGDGLSNTKNIVFKLSLDKWYPDQPCSLTEPFGPDVDFTIRIEDIIHKYQDEEYLEELMNGKYAGQTDVMFTHEETQRLNITETMVEGIWEFTVNFAADGEGIELLTSPIEVQSDIWRQYGEGIWDYDYYRENIIVTSVILRPLTVTLFYEDCNGGPTFSLFDTPTYAVMADGSRIELRDYGSSGVGGKALEAESPIVLEEVDYILFPDGTKLMVP